MSLKKKSVFALMWDFGGKLANQGVSFVVSVFLARLLLPEDFGTIAMINVVIGLATIFIDVGLTGALIQRKRSLKVHFNSVFYFNALVGALLSCLLYAGAPLLEDFYNLPGLSVYAEALSPIFFLSSLNSVQITKLRKQLNFQLLTKVRLGTAILSGVVGISMALLGYGIWSLVAQQLVQTGLTVVLLWTAGGWYPGLQFSFKALKQLWGFGFNMFLSGLLNLFVTRLDIIFIGKIFTASALGYYQRARSVDTLITSYTSGSLMQVLYPVLSQVQHEKERFTSIIEKSLHYVSFAAFGLVGIFYLCGEQLFILLFTEKWLPSAEYFMIMVLASYAYPVNSVLVNILSGKGKSKAFLQVEIIKKSIYLLNLVIGLAYGIEYFLYGYILTSFIATQLNIWFAKTEVEKSAVWFNKIIYGYGFVTLASVLSVIGITSFFGEFAVWLSIVVHALFFVLFYVSITTILGFRANKEIISELHQIKLAKQKI